MVRTQYTNSDTVQPTEPSSCMVSVAACFEIYLCLNLPGIVLFWYWRRHPQGLIIATLLTNIHRNLTAFIATDFFWLGTAGIYCRYGEYFTSSGPNCDFALLGAESLVGSALFRPSNKFTKSFRSLDPFLGYNCDAIRLTRDRVKLWCDRQALNCCTWILYH